jgi:hypothetical protein
MRNKELFINALSTLFFSWGSDTPAEVFWGCNELLDWYEKEYNVTLGIRFDEENNNFDEVINVIENL